MAGHDGRSSSSAIAGTALQVAGMWSIALGMGVYADTDYLSGIVRRTFFFGCCAVVVVAGFTRWKLRSLRPVPRIAAILLVLCATAVAVLGVLTTTPLLLPGVMLILAALGKRFVARAQPALWCVVALTAFSAFRAIDDLVRFHFQVLEAFVPVVALALNGVATYYALAVVRKESWTVAPTGPRDATPPGPSAPSSSSPS
jgi:hypothetical protein